MGLAWEAGRNEEVSVSCCDQVLGKFYTQSPVPCHLPTLLRTEGGASGGSPDAPYGGHQHQCQGQQASSHKGSGPLLIKQLERNEQRGETSISETLSQPVDLARQFETGHSTHRKWIG